VLGVPLSAYLLDEMSATTEENGVITRMLLRRTNFLGSEAHAGVVTNLCHMQRTEWAPSLPKTLPCYPLGPNTGAIDYEVLQREACCLSSSVQSF
jgi:hypothetical protein